MSFLSLEAGGREGLFIGYYLMTMQYAMRSSDMYAAIFVLAALGYAMNRGFLAVERRVLAMWFSHGSTYRQTEVGQFCPPQCH